MSRRLLVLLVLLPVLLGSSCFGDEGSFGGCGGGSDCGYDSPDWRDAELDPGDGEGEDPGDGNGDDGGWCWTPGCDFQGGQNQ